MTTTPGDNAAIMRFRLGKWNALGPSLGGNSDNKRPYETEAGKAPDYSKLPNLGVITTYEAYFDPTLTGFRRQPA